MRIAVMLHIYRSMAADQFRNRLSPGQLILFILVLFVIALLIGYFIGAVAD